MDSRRATVDGIETDERVNLEVGKVEVDVDGVKADEEVDEGFLLLCGDVREEGGRDGAAGGKRCVDGDVEFEGFGIYVTDVYAAFVGEKDGVALASGVDADVVLRMRRVGEERLDNEVVEGASDGLDLGDDRSVLVHPFIQERNGI